MNEHSLLVKKSFFNVVSCWRGKSTQSTVLIRIRHVKMNKGKGKGKGTGRKSIKLTVDEQHSKDDNTNTLTKGAKFEVRDSITLYSIQYDFILCTTIE